VGAGLTLVMLSKARAPAARVDAEPPGESHVVALQGSCCDGVVAAALDGGGVCCSGCPAVVECSPPDARCPRSQKAMASYVSSTALACALMSFCQALAAQLGGRLCETVLVTACMLCLSQGLRRSRPRRKPSMMLFSSTHLYRRRASLAPLTWTRPYLRPMAPAHSR
jgi:hypothetical protein